MTRVGDDVGETPTIYSERYVAFVDILGFSDIVRNSQLSPHQAAELVRVLERIRARASGLAIKQTDDLLGDDFKAQSFSDTIVLSEAASEVGLKYILFSVENLVLDLLAQGILTRGGIAKGLMHHTDAVAFGPAFLAAYHLESIIATYPRIIVDRSVHHDYLARTKANWDFLSSRLVHADDGPVHLDIFRRFRDIPSHLHAPSRLIVNGRSCRACIQTLLKDSIYNPHHFQKLRWLTIYWNGARLGAPPIDGLEPIDFPREDETA
jgi:hypothetical protein